MPTRKMPADLLSRDYEPLPGIRLAKDVQLEDISSDGSGTPADLELFRRAARAYARRTDTDERSGIAFVFGNGDWYRRANDVLNADAGRGPLAEPVSEVDRLKGENAGLEAKIDTLIVDLAAARTSRQEATEIAGHLSRTVNELRGRERELVMRLRNAEEKLAKANERLRAYKIGLEALGEAYLKIKEAE